MATYLVTGGCGFIGSHLADALVAAEHKVRIVDDLSTGKRENAPAQAEIIVGDIADVALMRRAMEGVDGCFHLAAIASVQRGNEDWLGTHRANLTGAITAFDLARTCNPRGPVPVVYASSAAVYGDNPNLPLKETSETRPLSAYGADKLGCELHARVAWVVHKVPSVGFRFFNIYGPRQDPKSPYSGVIAIFADRVKAGETITINGDGGQYRDFVYVADVVRHLVAAMQRMEPGARVFNICTGRSTTVLELAQLIARLAGRNDPKIEHGPARIGDIRESLGDPSAAKAAFGFTADTLIADGLKPTLGLGGG
jgi:UDP-glucose 4-epimerase